MDTSLRAFDLLIRIAEAIGFIVYTFFYVLAKMIQYVYFGARWFVFTLIFWIYFFVITSFFAIPLAFLFTMALDYHGPMTFNGFFNSAIYIVTYAVMGYIIRQLKYKEWAEEYEKDGDSRG